MGSTCPIAILFDVHLSTFDGTAGNPIDGQHINIFSSPIGELYCFIRNILIFAACEGGVNYNH